MKNILTLSICITLLATLGCGDRDPADIPAKELVQSDCVMDDDCPGGTCIAGIGSGLCTAACDVQADCPEGTVCTDTESTSGGVCLLTCTSNSECTDHLGAAYNCDTETNLTSGEDVRVCIDSN